MKWETVKLSECCSSIADGDHQSMPLSDSGIPFIVIADIRANSVDLSNSRFVPNSYYEALDVRRKPQKGDVLYTVKGSFGIPAYVNTNNPFTFQRDIAILKCNERVNSRFLYYVLKSDKYYKIADSLAIGSAQRALTLKTLNNLTIPCPPLETQYRIASILSAYDDLIENNQKQIKLLEEAAQRLYKEWFVDLRFPGHEHTAIVDGVPEGWERKKLIDIAEFKRGKTITRDSIIEGNVPVVAGGLEPAYYHNTANTISPVITVSGSGANAGFTRLYYENVWASDCSFADMNTTKHLYFVYCFLKANKDSIDVLQKGSAQPHVYAKDINNMEVIFPSEEYLMSFKNFSSSLFEKIKVLQGQIVNLTQARDRLLPKLMSGEMEV